MSSNAGNSTQPNDYDASTLGLPIPHLVVFVVIIAIAFVFLILHLVKGRSISRQPRRDVESAKGTSRESIDAQTLNEANPSQKYKQVDGFNRQATCASAQSSSAEVCVICLEVLVDGDNVRRLKCKHLFHMSCIDSWFQKHHVDCPLCKSIFIPNREGNPGPAEAR
ncbi:RING-type domain-containing protein [Fusarium falciforme]|uniref:RING-type domain-containing protein n=1 Tax=Fusarium falciforme TaxID=195108 RepID=UPI0023003F75|nr:RING-type domain-containing protein [Fusarium falciforme]WAO97028.1 RING-type domain-containing protein [Fusarium falciforme]